ncbi:hypothetical protein MTBLM5_410002 [Magnetospirillum sp. LM-5]|nr:hypothetical protein MTBLM5_410002 [Magnetospirillum sp. LM-5]
MLTGLADGPDSVVGTEADIFGLARPTRCCAERGGPGNSDNLLSYHPLRARILTHGQNYGDSARN